MTARDDYLELAELVARGRHVAHADAADALDTIDRLRAQLRTEWKVQEADIDHLRAALESEHQTSQHRHELNVHLDELIETLTTHADAMCNLLVKVRDGDYNFGEPVSDDGPGTARWDDLNEAIRDYTDFMKEC